MNTDTKTNHNELEALDDWDLEHKEQDIRGRDLVDPRGEKLGTIKDLLVDRSAELIAAVRLSDGRTFDVDALQIHKDKVVFDETAQHTPAKGATSGKDQSVEIVEEQIDIGKRDEQGDTIRVRSRAVTDTVEEDITLRDEEIDVARRNVNRTVSDADADALFEDRDIEVTERDERAVVGKKAVVTEEVGVSKTSDERVEHVKEDVRRTEVDVDRTSGESDAERQRLAKQDKNTPKR